MAPSIFSKLEKSIDSVEASSSSSRRQEKSSIEKITKKPTKEKTNKNDLNLEPIEILQTPLDKQLSTTIQEASSQFGVEKLLTATPETTGNLQNGNSATRKVLNAESVQRLHLVSSQRLHQCGPAFDLSLLNHLPCAQQYNPALEIGPSAPPPNAHQCCPSFEFGSSAPSPYTHQYNPTLDSGPFSFIVQPQQYDSPVDYDLPEDFKNPHQYNPTAETDARAAFQNSQHQGTGLDPALFERCQTTLQYNPLVTPTSPQSAECSWQNSALFQSALQGFQNSPQNHPAAFKRLATHHREARVLSQSFEAASSSLTSFQTQRQGYSSGAGSSVGSLQSLTEPIGTEAEPMQAIEESECSVDAAERNVWHMAMNKHGVYRPNGEIRFSEDGTMQWREKEGARWCNAVKHEDIRGQLLAECAQLGEYTYPRDKGKAVNGDITAFHPDQKDWAFRERHLRPEILHQYESRGHINPTYPVQIWLYNGKIVLDHVFHPILDFKNMPRTISSQVEGGLQEAITRQDFRIDVKDFRVRMPSDPKNQGVVSLPTLSAISMRRSRFRWGAGYLSWTPRTGSQEIKNFLNDLLPDSCKRANSTKGFRDLKPSEVKQMTLPNRGKYLSRAGQRRLSPGAWAESERTFRRVLRRAEEREGWAV